VVQPDPLRLREPYDNENVYRSSFYVDAPNAYGVMLRSRHSCVAVAEEDGWYVVSVKDE
jgi:hypothetical protein